MIQAIQKELESLKNNKVVREFVESEAYKQIAQDIAATPWHVCTEATARLIVANKLKNPNISERFEKYVAAGYTGLIMAKYAA